MKDYTELAHFIIEHVGGTENVKALTHCVTRLRFILKDESIADTNALKNNDEVLDVIQKGGQYQVVIGNHVEDVYDKVIEVGKFVNDNSSDDTKKQGIFNKFVSIISGIFNPLLGLMCACGIIKGLSVFIAALGLISNKSGTYIIINSIGDTVFYFFPVFLGYTAAEKFKMNKFVGAAIGTALVHPNIIALKGAAPLFAVLKGTIFQSNVTTTFAGIPVIMMNYANTVIPTILAVYVASKFEKFFKKIVPSVIKSFLVPALTLLFGVIITLLIVGPVSVWISDALGHLFYFLHDLSPIITGLVVGSTWQILVMFGVHQGIMPIMINNLIANGYDNVICCMQAVPFVTCAVVFAVYLKTKDKKLKKTALPAAISSFFGVSEPSIYGVTLPLKTPFIITLVSSGIGGAIMGALGSTMYTMGGMGLFAFPAYINPKKGFDMSFYGTIIAVVVAMIIGFVTTFIIYKDQNSENEAITEKKEEDIEEFITQEVFSSPVRGNVIPLAEVKDEVFASELTGKGVGIIPEEGKIYAPADGKVTMLFKTNHAIGLKTKSNADLLIHIGIDTVNLEGKGFKAVVKEGDVVKKGDLLIEFDKEFLKANNYDDTVIFVVTNTDQFQDVLVGNEKKADSQSELLAVAV